MTEDATIEKNGYIQAEVTNTAKYWREGAERGQQIMDYEDFDYFSGTLDAWVAQFTTAIPDYQQIIAMIADEYLPRFEQAIWKAAATMNAQGIKVTEVSQVQENN